MRMFNNMLSFKLASAMAIFLGAMQHHAFAQEQVSVFSLDQNRNKISVSVPVNPKNVAVADYAILDIMDRLDLGNKITGVTATGAVPEYLNKYQDNKQLTNIGTVKELDLEKLMALEPEVIFIGGRLAAKYEELSAIAPVVFLSVDYSEPLIESVKRNTSTIASIFQTQGKAQELIKSFEDRISKLKEQAQGKSAVVGMVNATQFKTLGNTGRCSMIGRDIGFNNLSKDIVATHGNESSFELLLKLNPEYIFILDRDSAIATQGAKLAKDVMNNELVHKTDAFKNNKITYLNSAVWYLSEGGLTATDLMLQDLETALK
ncbi:MAG: siderophore ABC transporter substrate-binding protein [Anaerobiospirillum succiniciproducens]|uniref:siderophore ABC transporter substrate-binding protein n=1 Tax=Anaerobiospirillum succiniciproducens TaxID=13335 RepID=UPI002A754E1E|nr:siderophore ABC transporter substrate-binding protein [Anaerobiospirillum succiniciproducens]MDY2799204.1 siderophore ABC transporter substrate-binding protein [Anaerobiospirillum succiniciproducens]